MGEGDQLLFLLSTIVTVLCYFCFNFRKEIILSGIEKHALL